VPVFNVANGLGGYLPNELPAGGLPLASLEGLASRDGLAVALARQLQDQTAVLSPIKASATGST
jgi:hypothetical protein